MLLNKEYLKRNLLWIFGCLVSYRFESICPLVGPGTIGGVPSLGFFLRERVPKKTTENSEWLGQQARPGFEPGTPRLPILSVTTPQLVGLMNIWKTAYSVYLYFLYHFLMFTVWKNYPFRLSQFKDNRYCTVYTSFPLQYNFYYSKYFNHKIK